MRDSNFRLREILFIIKRRSRCRRPHFQHYYTTHFNGRLGNTNGIDRDHGTENRFTKQRSHENSTNRRGRGHEHAQGDIATGNVRAQIRRLAAINAAHQHHAGHQGLVQAKCRAETECQHGHDGVAERELHNGGIGTTGHLGKIGRRQCNAHGQHECGEAGGKVFRREPGK